MLAEKLEKIRPDRLCPSGNESKVTVMSSSIYFGQDAPGVVERVRVARKSHPCHSRANCEIKPGQRYLEVTMTAWTPEYDGDVDDEGYSYTYQTGVQGHFERFRSHYGNQHYYLDIRAAMDRGLTRAQAEAEVNAYYLRVFGPLGLPWCRECGNTGRQSDTCSKRDDTEGV